MSAKLRLLAYHVIKVVFYWGQQFQPHLVLIHLVHVFQYNPFNLAVFN